MNLYAYVGGDPVNLVDPYGFEECPPSAPDHPVRCARRFDSRMFFDTFERDLYFMEVLEELQNAFPINENPVKSQGNQQLHCTSGVPTSNPAAKNQQVFVGDELGNAVFSYDLPVGAPTRKWDGNYTNSVTGTGTATGAAGGGASGMIAGGRIGATYGAAEGAHLGPVFGTMAVSEATFSGGILGGVYGAIAGAAFGLAVDLRVQSDLVEHCEPIS